LITLNNLPILGDALIKYKSLTTSYYLATSYYLKSLICSLSVISMWNVNLRGHWQTQ